jgi:Cys-tRNA(Pro)/Cys-tRNA(Cys) deacylase
MYSALEKYIKENNINAKIIDLGVAMKTAELAAQQLNTNVKNIFKSIFLCHKKTKIEREYALAVLAGSAQIDLSKIAICLGWSKSKISFATPDVVHEKTGFPAGGTPPIGHKEIFPIIIDSTLLSIGKGYAGGGLPELLLEIEASEIVRVSSAVIADISIISNSA